MKELIVYYVTFAKFIWYEISSKLNMTIVGRIFEGISIGLYANGIDKFIGNSMSYDLLYKLIIAIIFTAIGVTFQREEKK